RDVQDPAARPARGTCDECLLHHPGFGEARDVRDLHGSPAARGAACRTREVRAGHREHRLGLDRGTRVRQRVWPGTTCTFTAESGSKLLRRDDSFGYSWVVVQDADLEDQVTAAHAVAQGLEEQGFGEQLLAAVFKFDGGKHPVYLVYGYKRGAFWPFVPTGKD